MSETAKEVLAMLVFFGCTRHTKCPLFAEQVTFDPLTRRPTKSDVVNLARLIRKAALLERSGSLVADIDRQGRVIGWHRHRD